MGSLLLGIELFGFVLVIQWTLRGMTASHLLYWDLGAWTASLWLQLDALLVCLWNVAKYYMKCSSLWSLVYWCFGGSDVVPGQRMSLLLLTPELLNVCIYWGLLSLLPDHDFSIKMVVFQKLQCQNWGFLVLVY